MADIHDVVRHVILKILVDQESLAGDLAAAREKLKAFEQGERDSNKRRSKDTESVTKALDVQNDALQRNARAHADARQAAQSGAVDVASVHRDATKAINEHTAAQQRAGQVSSQLTAQQARDAQKLKAQEAADLLRNAALKRKLDQDDEDYQVNRARRLRAENARLLSEISRARSSASRGDSSARRESSYADSAARSDADLADSIAVSTGRRRVQAQQEINQGRQKEALLARQIELIEQRIARTAEDRARADERASRLRGGQTRRGLVETARVAAAAVGSVVQGNAEETRLLRAARAYDEVRSSTQRATEATRTFYQDTSEAGRRAQSTARDFIRNMGGIEPTARKAGDSIRAAFNAFRSGGGGGGPIERLRALTQAFKDTDDGGRGLGTRLKAAFADIGDGMARSSQKVVRGLFSWRGAVLAVLAALGPLGASIGALGAAALGLVANLASLTGVLFALPGLLSAIVGGFGVLAAVIAPLSKVFTAYKAAQDASTISTKDAEAAADKLAAAQRRLRDAQQENDRAIRDQPRAERGLADARKQATRQIEDYRTALQRLRFEQESAQLGVESAEAAYRRALADPTKSNLDRKIARNDFQGALYQREDQDTTNRRLVEDATEALAKGVEGSDAYVAALDRIQDASDRVRDAAQELADAQHDLNDAQKDSAAGSAANRSAQEKLAAELDKLGPKTRKVVVAFKDMGGAWKQLQTDLSEAVFGPASNNTNKFKDVLGSLRAFLTPTAKAFGELADTALKLFTSAPWKKFFEEQGEANGEIIKDLGTAALSFADGLKAVTETARPFTDFVTKGLAGLADGFKMWAESDKGREGLKSFLDDTMLRIRQLKPVFTNLAAGFAGFFKALTTGDSDGGKDFVTKTNEGLLGLATTFRKLGEDAAKPNSGFRQWLRDVGPLIESVVAGVGDIFKFFGRLFSDKANIEEAKKIFASLGDTLQKLADFFEQLSESDLVSQLVTAFGNIAAGAAAILDGGFGAVIQGFVTALAVLTGAVSFVVGGIAKVLTYFGLIDGSIKSIGQVIGFVFGALLIAYLIRANKLVGGIVSLLKAVFTGNTVKLIDSAKDKFFGREDGESGARRNAREANRNRPAGTPKVEVDRTNVGGVLPTLYRIELNVAEIARNSRRWGGGSSTGRGGSGGSGGAGRGTGPFTGPYGGSGGPGGFRSPGDILEPDQRPQRHPGNTLDPENRVQGGRTTPFRAGGFDVVSTGPLQSQNRRFYDIAERGRILNQQRLDRLNNGTPLGNSDRRARTTIGGFDTVSTGPLRTGDPRSRNTDFDIVETADQRERNARFRDAAASSQRAIGGSNRRAITTGPQFETVSSGPLVSRNGYADGYRTLQAQQAIRDAEQRDRDARYRESLGQPAIEGPQTPRRYALEAGTVQQPRDANGRFRPVAPGESATTGQPMRDANGRFTSTTRANLQAEFDSPRRGLPANLNPTFIDGPDRDTDRVDARTTSQGSARRRARNRLRGRFGGLLSNLGSFLADDSGSIPFAGFGRRGRTTNPDVLEGDIVDRLRRGTDDDIDAFNDRRIGDTRRPRRGEVIDGDFTEDMGARRGVPRPRGRAGRVLGGLGRFGRGAGRLGGSLLLGAAGGQAGLAVSAGLALGGDYAIDKYVKNADDRDSIRNGLGAVSNGAFIGGLVGSVVPGVGTAIGSAVGGVAGGIYGLATDKNLRSFVGDKAKGLYQGAKNFAGDAFEGVKNFVGKPSLGGAAAGLAVGGPIGALLGGTDIGKNILDSLGEARKGVSDFFTRDIPRLFQRGVRGIEDFFTKTLPSLPGKAFDAITTGFGFLAGFFLESLPRLANTFFTETIPDLASQAWEFVQTNLWDPFVGFIEGIPGFFTETIPRWFDAFDGWVEDKVRKPLRTFITETIPNFFTDTIPKWFDALPENFENYIRKPLATFFTETLPKFFTETLPGAIASLPDVLYSNIVEPVVGFFSGLGDHIGDFIDGSLDWARNLFKRANSNAQRGYQSGANVGKMSGGLIEGIYQGIEDTDNFRLTRGEFVVRRSKVQQPDGKRFLNDYNEGRFNPADFYAGLSGAMVPPSMSLVPDDARALTAMVPSVVNNSVDRSLNYGDIVINNPVRERSEHSLRRQLQIQAIRHRM